MTSFALFPARLASLDLVLEVDGDAEQDDWACPWQRALSAGGGEETSKWSASRPTATSFKEARSRAVSRTRALFKEAGIRTRTPFFCVLLALNVLAV